MVQSNGFMRRSLKQSGHTRLSELLLTYIDYGMANCNMLGVSLSVSTLKLPLLICKDTYEHVACVASLSDVVIHFGFTPITSAHAGTLVPLHLEPVLLKNWKIAPFKTLLGQSSKVS